MSNWSMLDPKKLSFNYKTYELGRWEHEVDNGADMLACPKCKCRAIMEPFLRAVGTKGLRFCPYCGEDLRDIPGQMEMEDFLKEEPDNVSRGTCSGA